MAEHDGNPSKKTNAAAAAATAAAAADLPTIPAGSSPSAEVADTVAGDVAGDVAAGAPASAPGAASAPGLVDLRAHSLADAGFDERYRSGALLGRGGMGEVRLVLDAHVGRSVAMKVVRPGREVAADARLRFVREARVQGQLEHPSIVPVYDLGLTPGGVEFFTMKRVRGRTLAEIVEGLRAGDPGTVAAYSRRKLLSAFSAVCLAVHFAHTRGVLHRDLKPQNLMLGDFGEVYVLDWGLAKVAGAPDPDAAAPAITPDSGPLPPGVVTHTVDGSLMGTPGYMAPEQIEGAPADARSDVYALGALLFELLALEPLHRRASLADVLASTLAGADARPTVRAPERQVPPELDAVCVRATARAPEERFESARALHEAVERFLDGDRDLELRRALARRHARAAEEEATAALATGPGALDARRRAIREVSRALALDPEERGALRTMVRLLVEPPAEMPAEARRALDRAENEALRDAGRLGVAAYAVSALSVPLVLWMGIRNVATMLFSMALLALAVAVNVAVARQRERVPRWLPHLSLWASTAFFATAAFVNGPFLLLPAVLAANGMAYAMHVSSLGRAMPAIASITGFVGPLLLEWAGLVPPSYAFRDDALVILPRASNLPAVPTLVFLVVIGVTIIAGAAAYASRFRLTLEVAERRLRVQAWQLQQLVPEGEAPAPPR